MTDTSAHAQARLKRMIDQGAGKEPADLVAEGRTLLRPDLRPRSWQATSPSARTASSARAKIIAANARSTFRARSSCPASSTRICTSNPRWSPRMSSTAALLPRGITTAICDPHENLQRHRRRRHKLFSRQRCRDDHGHPRQSVELRAGDRANCETAGARLDIEDLLPFADHREGHRTGPSS